MKKANPPHARHEVNRRQKALAIKILERALVDPATPPHSATAARTLLNDGARSRPNPTPTCRTLPRRARSSMAEIAASSASARSASGSRSFTTPGTPEGLADMER